MADQETTKMNLTNDVTVNGVKYHAGRGVEVPKAQADNIAEIDHTHNLYLQGLNKKRTTIVDAGTIGVGGGGE
jgi:hypothetical protein